MAKETHLQRVHAKHRRQEVKSADEEEESEGEETSASMGEVHKESPKSDAVVDLAAFGETETRERPKFPPPTAWINEPRDFWSCSHAGSGVGSKYPPPPRRRTSTGHLGPLPQP